MASLFWRLFAPDLKGPYDIDNPKKKSSFFYRLMRGSSRLVKTMDENLETDMKDLREYVLDFNKKVSFLNDYMQHRTDLPRLTSEIKKINSHIVKEKAIEKNENRSVIQSIKSIDRILDKEPNIDLKLDEQDMRTDLTSISDILAELDPILAGEQRFLKLKLDEQREQFGDFVRLVHKEANIIDTEKQVMQELKHDIERFEVKEVMAN